MLLPAATVSGAATFVVIRSASVERATMSVAVALLLVKFGSVVAELTVTVSLIAVPCTVPAVTCSTTEKVVDPAAKLGLEHVIVPAVPAVGVEHDHPPVGGLIEKNVVFGGVVSVNDALVAALGPPLVTTCVYVMLLPACTGTGLATLVTERSAEAATTTLTEAVLLPGLVSVVAEETVAVSVSVDPEVTVVLTVTTKVKVAVPLAARLPMVQVRVAKVQVHPGAFKDCAVVPAGAVSVSLTVVAAAGPPFVTTCV